MDYEYEDSKPEFEDDKELAKDNAAAADREPIRSFLVATLHSSMAASSSNNNNT
jgi:hypothetical protein